MEFPRVSAHNLKCVWISTHPLHHNVKQAPLLNSWLTPSSKTPPAPPPSFRPKFNKLQVLIHGNAVLCKHFVYFFFCIMQNKMYLNKGKKKAGLPQVVKSPWLWANALDFLWPKNEPEQWVPRKIYHIVYSEQIRDERCIFFLKNPSEP